MAFSMSRNYLYDINLKSRIKPYSGICKVYRSYVTIIKESSGNESSVVEI